MSDVQWLRKYETVIVTRPDAGHEAHKDLYEKIQAMVQKHQAHHVCFHLWGKRRLAYPIQKHVKGVYLYHVFLAGQSFVQELQRMLRLNPIVLRFLTVLLDPRVNPATFDFEKEGQFDSLPTDPSDSDRSRATTGWEAEFQGREFSSAEDEDEDEEEDEEDKEGSAEERPEENQDEDEEE